MLAALPPGHWLPPGTCEPACRTKRTAAGSNRAANAEASPDTSTLGEPTCHANGSPTGAELVYPGSFVDGPVADDPGTTGTCDGAVAEGVVGAGVEDVEDEAPDEAEEPPEDAAEPDAPVGEAPPALLPAGAAPEAEPGPLDEHPDTATTTVATAAEATLKRFLNMLLTGITLDVHPESTLSDLPVTDSPGYSCIRTR